MGQLFSSPEELSQVSDVMGSLLYDAMLEGGAVPDLGVVHPFLLASHDEGFVSRTRLQEQLQQLQADVSTRVPTYLRDLIGRLTTFSDEPRLAGLVGVVVGMVMDMAYTSSRQSSGVKWKSSSRQHRLLELQDLMEEYLKRVRINMSDKTKLIQDSIRLEGQLSLSLTQLHTCLAGGDIDSRSLRHWASGAAFHTQMLVHLACLEGEAEPLSARRALELYMENLAQIIPAYRRYKSNTVCVVKCHGGLVATGGASCPELEEGSMTGLTVTDREMGKSVTIPLSAMETATAGRRVSDASSPPVSPCINLDLITSDQYAQVYLDRLFSAKGPVAELESYFSKACDNLRTLRTQTGCKSKTGEREQSAGEQRASAAGDNKRGEMERRGGRDEAVESERRGESLKLSIVETQPEENRDCSLHGTET